MRQSKSNMYEKIKKAILKDKTLDDSQKSTILKNIIRLKKKKLNIMITGATGSGKSSTINALFDTDVAKVGIGVDPETMDIEKYELENMILWDSPGLGDGKENDNLHSKAIIKKLYEKNSDGELLIDVVLVILDGSTRDLGTSYELINNVIIPNMGENVANRLLVAINQADVAMKGPSSWNYETNRPTPEAEAFLEAKVHSVKKRIEEATGVVIDPVYYAAGYKEEGIAQRPYNLSKLLYLILQDIPAEKRIFVAENISQDNDMWKDNDEIRDYNEENKRTFIESARLFVSNVTVGISGGMAVGAAIGSIIPIVGTVVGGAIGGIIGGIAGGIASLFGW